MCKKLDTRCKRKKEKEKRRALQIGSPCARTHTQIFSLRRYTLGANLKSFSSCPFLGKAWKSATSTYGNFFSNARVLSLSSSQKKSRTRTLKRVLKNRPPRPAYLFCTSLSAISSRERERERERAVKYSSAIFERKIRGELALLCVVREKRERDRRERTREVIV